MSENPTDSIYNFTVKAKKGQIVNLSDYKGKVLLIVNTASRCGFTYQYKELEELYEQYNGKGFLVLDFPCNQFGNQAPENEEEYTNFCQLNYKTKFPQFAKIEVNGENEEPLYKWLKSKKPVSETDNHKFKSFFVNIVSKVGSSAKNEGDIKWNFTKFLVDKNGNVVERFESTSRKEDLIPSIERELNK